LLGGEVAIKLLRSLTVLPSLLSTISRCRIHKRNLFEARVIIASYNDHCPAPFYPSLFGWFGTTEVYSGIGAGVVMESIFRDPPTWLRAAFKLFRNSPLYDFEAPKGGTH
jgi:hypothetical protein